MVGSELNPTQGKQGGKPGDIGVSSFPSASHSKPALQALAGVFSRGFSLSFLGLCSETARKHLLRRLGHPGAFISWLLALKYLTSARRLVMGSCLCLFVCLFLLVFVTFYVQGLLLCVLPLYVSHWNANKLFHFPRVKVLCPLFYLFNFSIISRDTSCDSVRPIKAFLRVNQDGSFFLCKSPFNFFGKFSNFQLFLSVLQSWADSMFSPTV